MTLQIAVVEIGKSNQAIPVADFQPSGFPFDQAEVPELLNDAVGMNAGNSAGIGNVGLSPWHAEREIARAADRLEPRRQFAEDMRQSRRGVAAPKIDNPFLKDAGLH